MSTKYLDIAKINVDGGTQVREELNEQAVADYAEAIRNGVELPPIDVFFDGMTYWLADGFHRIAAALDADKDKIRANVHAGRQRDAMIFGCGAAKGHGVRFSNPDKRKAATIMLSDAECVTWSNKKIAEHIGVSDMLIGDVRKQLQESCGSEASKVADQPRVGTDGKKRKAPAPRPEREQKSTPKHVVDTPKEEPPKRKITGGVTFNVEEFSDDPPEPAAPEPPKPSKPESHFDDSRFERAYGPLVKVVAERHVWLGQKKSEGFRRTDKALAELLAAFKDWQKKEPV